ncbi:MAG: hypothetical protein HDR17_10225 [Lachnospiraceae bacterium]|nr:hypothetical protein [Lachnospiraceae bacterium]
MYYLYLFGYTIKSKIMYRVTFLIDVISALLTCFIQTSLWQALLSGNYVSGLSFEVMVPYVIITYFSAALTRINIATTIEDSIRDGSILYNLIRPVNYRRYLLCSMIGENTFKACINTLIIFAASIFVYGIYVPKSLLCVLGFAISLAFGVLLMFEITYVCGLSAFWLQRTWFIEWFLEAFVIFFGGSAVPLWFYPEILQKISVILPFRYVSYEAINIYLGNYNVKVCITKILISIFWIIVLRIAGAVIWKHAKKRVEINGG